MNDIDLTIVKDPERVLKNALEPGLNPPGTKIKYFTGDYSSNVHKTKVGTVAWGLSEAGLVHLVQRLVNKEPRVYDYYAVVK